MKSSWIACFLLLPLLLSQAQGSSRKLPSMDAPTSKNEKISNVGNVGSGKTSTREVKRERLRIKSVDYPDVLDIAGMDYSPAKRKTPIHN